MIKYKYVFVCVCFLFQNLNLSGQPILDSAKVFYMNYYFSSNSPIRKRQIDNFMHVNTFKIHDKDSLRCISTILSEQDLDRNTFLEDIRVHLILYYSSGKKNVYLNSMKQVEMNGSVFNGEKLLQWFKLL